MKKSMSLIGLVGFIFIITTFTLPSPPLESKANQAQDTTKHSHREAIIYAHKVGRMLSYLAFEIAQPDLTAKEKEEFATKLAAAEKAYQSKGKDDVMYYNPAETQDPFGHTLTTLRNTLYDSKRIPPPQHHHTVRKLSDAVNGVEFPLQPLMLQEMSLPQQNKLRSRKVSPNLQRMCQHLFQEGKVITDNLLKQYKDKLDIITKKLDSAN